ncbi:hypothetical protein KAR91_70405 [Candidatus Pacearchaeota archaeon]|nr:hypothetical protein [Candidatus Pacearchaeota archaeon]
MKSLKYEEQYTKRNYDDFTLNQIIGVMDIGDEVTITYKDADEKEVTRTFTCSQINGHFSFTFQDKGERDLTKQAS